MTVFIVFNTDWNKAVYSTYSKDIAFAKLMDLMREGKFSFKDGRHYCPYVILDTYVHTKDCMCSKCTGLEEE